MSARPRLGSAGPQSPDAPLLPRRVRIQRVTPAGPLLPRAPPLAGPEGPGRAGRAAGAEALPLRITAGSSAGAQRPPEDEEEVAEVGWQEKLFSQVGAWERGGRDFAEWVRSEGITGVFQSGPPAQAGTPGHTDQACVQLALKYL